MFKQIRKMKAQSLIEYTGLIVFILTAFLLFQKYIARGFSGRWRSVGDALGGGTLYDPKRTEECVYDFQYTDPNVWYNKACFDANCDCLSAAATTATCRDCITACATSRCNN